MVSIIIPTFNEAENIVPLIKAIDREVKQPYEIIVVDDDSPDGTSTIVSDFIKKNRSKHIRLETRLSDHGLTKSIQQGIDLAKGDVIAWIDCDFSMPPLVLAQLIEAVGSDCDITVGSRFIPGGQTKRPDKQSRDSPIAVVLSSFLNRVLMVLFRMDYYDFTSGFVAVKRKVTESIRLRGDYGEYFIDFIVRAKRQGYKIIEIPFVNAPRLHGESKTGGSLLQLLKHGYKYILIIIRLFIFRNRL